MIKLNNYEIGIIEKSLEILKDNLLKDLLKRRDRKIRKFIKKHINDVEILSYKISEISKI